MKNRLPHHKSRTLFFNLGLHHPEKPNLLRSENYRYQRNNETLENSIPKSLRLTEFINFFWILLETRSNIAIINTDDRREKVTFSYENLFAGNHIKCYEGSWIPGVWTNSFLKNPMPDLVILLSVSVDDRTATLRQIEDLDLPVINFSSENSRWEQFTYDLHGKHRLTYFYMELIRFLLIRFQERQRSLQPATKFPAHRIDLKRQMRRLLDCYRNQKATFYSPKVWSPSKNRAKKELRKQHLQKNLISPKKGRRLPQQGFAILFLTPRISFSKRISYYQKKAR